MKNKYDVVIIGSGLGGLLCGNILAREGLKVCVIEKNKKIGGCLQIFSREKCIFNTGLNYTEGLAEGQILYHYFQYFGILNKLKIKQLDIDGFELITFGGKEYRIAQGEENFVNTLAQYFPEERENIRKYLETIKSICLQFPFYNLSLPNDYLPDYDNLLQQGAFEFIQSITKNRVLQNVLAGNNMLYAGVAGKTPLYIHALISYSFISSSWRLVNGSQSLATVLADSIIQHSGCIIRGNGVRSLLHENNAVVEAELEDGNRVEAKYFISNVHPVNTIKLLGGSAFTKIFRNRIESLENSLGMFTVYIVLKERSFPYLNHNHYYFEGESVWVADSISEAQWPQTYFLYTPATSRSDTYADGIIVMTYMGWDELKMWETTSIENRGEDYIRFKEDKAEKLIDLVEKKFPDLRASIQSIYTSTPLTYRDYTGTPQGSAYGILKDFNEPYRSIIMPKTRLSNLFFTGQNLNLHGILGVTVGAVMTCGEIVGLKYLRDKVRQAAGLL